MNFLKLALTLFAGILFLSSAQAQNRQYHIYADTDNNSMSGCTVNWAGLGAQIEGAERRLTVTTDSQVPPNIISSQVHNCQGNVFDAGSPGGQAAIGLNTGMNGDDVFEFSINSMMLGVNSSGNVLFYFAAQSDDVADVVLTGNSGGPIFFGFAFPIPTLGLMGLLLMASLLLLMGHKKLNKKLKVTAVMVFFVSTAWAMVIVVDGQVNDWNGVSAVADDPTGDTDGTGSFADITAIYQFKNENGIFFRMDVVDVENQAPIANDSSDNTLEEQLLTITLTGSDPEGEALTFATAMAPANGTLNNYQVLNDTTSTVDYTPNTDFVGDDTFTVMANDGQVDSAPATITVTVNPINDAPSFTSGGDVNVLKTAGPYSQTWATNLSAGPSDEASQNLTFNITSNDNAALFSQQPSIDGSGVLTFTGAADASGTANLTVELMDDGGTANGGVDTSAAVNFSIILEGVNDEPSFTVGPDQSVNEDAGAQTINNWATNILAGPPDESGQTLTFNVTANTNAALFSSGPAVAADGTLTYALAADANGSAMVTIELMDDGGTANGGDDTSPPQSFDINVTAVNDAPSFNVNGDVNALEDSGAFMMTWATAISPGPSDESAQVLSFNISNDNNALFSAQPTLDSNGQLSFTPAPDASGTAVVTVSLMDDGGVANGGVDTSADQMFNININDINDEPSFTIGSDQSVNENSGNNTVPNWATNITAGPANESGQILTFNVTNNTNAGLFSAGPAVASDGTLSFTPAADLFGTATITIELMDDGGTANGGDDTSPTQSFMIEVVEANTPPTLTAPGPFTVNANIGITVPDGADDLLAGASDADPSDTLSIQGGNSITTAQNGTVTLNTTTGTFEYQPPAGYTGADSFDYVVCDDGTPQECTVATSVTLNVSGPVVWFIDNGATAGGDGTYSEPFDSITAHNTADSSAIADRIYIASSLTSYGGSGLVLKDNQVLIGQGATGTFASLTGITAAAYSYTLPTQSTLPVITSSGNGINLANGNTLRGIEIANTSNYALRGTTAGSVTVSEVAITGSGSAIEIVNSAAFSANFNNISSSSSTAPVFNLTGSGGSLTIAQAGTGIIHNTNVPALQFNNSTLNFQYPGNLVNNSGRSIQISNQSGGTVAFTGLIDDNSGGISLTNNMGAAINFNVIDLNTMTNNAFTATGGGTINVSGAGSIINTTTGMGINMQNVAIGASGVSVQTLNVNGATTGILLDTVTGAGSFSVSGGTVQNNSTSGITIMDTNSVTINNMNFTNSTNESAGCLAGVAGVTGTCHAAIELLNANNITINNTTVDGNGDASDELGIYAHQVGNFNMNGVTVQNVSDQVDEHGIYAINLTGNNLWRDLTVNNSNGDSSILVVQNAGSGTLLIDGDSTISNAPEVGFEARTVGATAILNVTIGDASAVNSGDTVLIENTNIGAIFVAQDGILSGTVRNSIIQPGGVTGTMFIGISGQSDATGDVILNTTGNLVTQDDGGNGGTGRNVSALGGAGNINGNITNNSFNSNDEFVNGLFTNFTGTGTTSNNIINVENNTIDMTGSGGNETITGIQYRASNSDGGLSMNITNNTIDSAGDNSFSGGIISLSGNTSGSHDNILCNDIVSNDVSAPAATGGSDDYVFVSFTGTDNRLENSQLGLLTETHIDTHITDNDAGITTDADVFVYPVGTGTFTGVNSCPQ